MLSCFCGFDLLRALLAAVNDDDKPVDVDASENELLMTWRVKQRASLRSMTHTLAWLLVASRLVLLSLFCRNSSRLISCRCSPSQQFEELFLRRGVLLELLRARLVDDDRDDVVERVSDDVGRDDNNDSNRVILVVSSSSSSSRTMITARDVRRHLLARVEPFQVCERDFAMFVLRLNVLLILARSNSSILVGLAAVRALPASPVALRLDRRVCAATRRRRRRRRCERRRGMRSTGRSGVALRSPLRPRL